MSIFFIFIPAFALACTAEYIANRPRRPKVYRKTGRRSFGWAPARLRL